MCAGSQEVKIVGLALTISEIARLLGQPWYKVDYVVKSRGIKPVLRAGGVRIFSPEALNEVEAACVLQKKS